MEIYRRLKTNNIKTHDIWCIKKNIGVLVIIGSNSINAYFSLMMIEKH